MALTKSNGLGIGGTVGAIAMLALGGVVACGSDFAGDDCKATRTCTGVGGSQGDEPSPEGGTQSDIDGTAAKAGTDSGATSGGAAGAPAEPEAAAAGQAMCEQAGPCEPGNAPPAVIAVSPASDATAVDPATQVVISFSEPIAEATVTPDSIRILDGEAAVPGTLSVAEGKVTFVPNAPLGLLAQYEISVATSVTDLEGAALLDGYSSLFRTRDGAWHASNAVTDTLSQIADTIPITDRGDVLVSWIAINSPGYYCPTSARWFNRGKGVSAATSLTSLDVQDCRGVAVGANAAGVGVVAWQEDFEYAQQFRAGKWLAAKGVVSKLGWSSRFAVGVAPNGAVSFLQQGGSGTSAWRADSQGKWATTADSLSTDAGLSSARIAFDTSGNGFAVWRAKDATGYEKILVSRYTEVSGKWAAATALPGSTATVASTDYERGAPAVAVDSGGEAVALWVREAGVNESSLMASRFSNGGWGAAVAISGAAVIKTLSEPPALVFDGKTFVAAWTGQDDTAVLTYSARFDMQFNQFEPFEQRSPLPSNLARMPQLGADAHQNLLMTWAKFRNGGGTLIFQRYDAAAEAWSAAAEVPGGMVTDDRFATSGPMPLSANASGLAVLMWGDKNDELELSTVRLASFH